MLDGLFEIVSGTLNFFYTLIPNYAVAIALLTCVVMIITTPLTLKGTRSMIEMQRLQPEIRRLQVQYKDDRQKLNEELMAFYREHQINPVGGCLPLLIQAPVFSILYYVVRGLTNQAQFVAVQKIIQADYSQYVPGGVTVTEGFQPKYLNSSDELYQSLLGQDHMNAFGVNLAESPAQALSEGFLHALPYIFIVAVIAFLSWYQQRQIMGRNAGAEVSQQQQLMMRIGPLLYVFFAFVSPAAICVYFLVSTLWRVGQQHYITRSLYHGEDSVGVQAQKAMAELREAKKKEAASKGGTTAKGGGSGGSRGGVRGGTPSGGRGSRPSGNGSSSKPQDGKPADRATAGAGAGPKPHPRSRKKRKRK